jgi:hypothetical protein
VTDGHFSGYHITSIRILITGRPFRAGIARAHAPAGSRITDLITGAEQSVVLANQRLASLTGTSHTSFVTVADIAV